MEIKLISRLLLASLMLFPICANSAIITYNLTGTVISPGPFLGNTGSGTFSYDDNDITGVGVENIDANASLTLNFTIFGQSFTEADDVARISFGAPVLQFNDGALVFLDFYVSELTDGVSDNVVSIDQVGVLNFGFDIRGNSLTPIAGGFETGIFVNDVVVPVPAAFWLFGSGLIGLIGIARRKKS